MEERRACISKSWAKHNQLFEKHNQLFQKDNEQFEKRNRLLVARNRLLAVTRFLADLLLPSKPAGATVLSAIITVKT
jgi:hypothetical protein